MLWVVASMDEKRLKFLNKRRAVIKRKVTLTRGDLETDVDSSNRVSYKEILEDYFSNIQKIDTEINELYCTVDDEGVDEKFDTEIASQTSYNIDIKKLITSLVVQSESIPSSHVKDEQEQLGQTVSNVPDCKLKLPDLNCDTFTGEGTSNLEFHSFMSQFNNIIGHRANLSNSTKLTYLKTYLKGYAHKLIQNLQICFLSMFLCLY